MANCFSQSLQRNSCSLPASKYRYSTGSVKLKNGRMAGMSVCKQRRRNLRSASAGESDEEKAPELEEDVRDFRAKLIAQEWKGRGGLAADAMKSGSGWIYETPLIEKGAVLLGGTRQRFGFGIRQQYFHKCVLLLIQHDNFFTKGIILNRPSAKKYQGWDVWFGGDVQEGGMFRSHFPQDSGPQNLLPEVICLHRLGLPEALSVSTCVIKSIYSTSLERAQELVSTGVAQKTDFWVFMGYCGWAPKQLQSELERNSWYMTAADSSLLLDELLSLASNPSSLPQLIDDGTMMSGGDGIDTWNRLMQNIGKQDEIENLESESRNLLFEDLMLREWVRQNLVDNQLHPSSGVVELEVGSLLLSLPSPRFLLNQQYLHKSILVVVEHTPNLTVAVVLNRPTSTFVQIEVDDPVGDGEIARRVCFGGEASVHGKEVYMCLLPSEQAPQDSVALGSSGLSRIGSIVPSEAQCREMLVVRGFVYWQDNRLEQDLKDGHYAVVPPEAVPWQDVLDLCSGHDHSTGGSEIWTCKSIGIGCWEECHRRAGLPSAKATGESSLSLADLALLEWGKFFA